MIRTLAFGLLFGFFLSRVGATDFDAIAGMFLLVDFHLVGVIGLAMVVAGLGLAIIERRGLRSADGAPMIIARKAMKPGLIVGGLLFGAGWAMTGTCPGTALSQLGEGKITAVFTIAGIVAGTALYQSVGVWLEERLLSLRRGDSARATTSETA
ncbi:MAG: DUF6691 family protein [Myxococcota bacterium]